MSTKSQNEFLPKLSKREIQVLALLAKGFSQTQVAEQIYISPHTVNFHVRNILAKFMTANITAAVALAAAYQLIQVRTPTQQ